MVANMIRSSVSPKPAPFKAFSVNALNATLEVEVTTPVRLCMV